MPSPRSGPPPAPDLTVEATTRVAPPFSGIVFRRSREGVLLRGGRIDGGEGFTAEETDVSVWPAIGAHSDGKVVAGGRDDFGSVQIARFWP